MKKFEKNTPYNALPPLPPMKNVETMPILRKTVRASRALAHLNGMIKSLPNPQLFIDTIYLQEAKASSAIENIITTNDELFRAVIADKNNINPAAKEIISYKEALWTGIQKLEERPFITTNLCVEIVQSIKKNTAGVRKTAGTKLVNSNGETIYTPPSGEDVIRTKLSELEQFINTNNSLDPLIKMALTHYQFEAIHPFIDGNGRTGRILLLLQLKMERLLDIPAIYLSEYIIANKTEYYQCLRMVTEENEWENWILYMLDMIEITSGKVLERLNAILRLMDEVGGEIKDKLPRVYSKDLVEVLFKLPYTKRKFLAEAGIGTPKTVGNYLNMLEAEGILNSIKIGKEKLYLNHQLMEILEQS